MINDLYIYTHIYIYINGQLSMAKLNKQRVILEDRRKKAPESRQAKLHLLTWVHPEMGHIGPKSTL